MLNMQGGLIFGGGGIQEHLTTFSYENWGQYWSHCLSSQSASDLLMNPCCHYFPPGPQLPPQQQSIITL